MLLRVRAKDARIVKEVAGAMLLYEADEFI